MVNGAPSRAQGGFIFFLFLLVFYLIEKVVTEIISNMFFPINGHTKNRGNVKIVSTNSKIKSKLNV